VVCLAGYISVAAVSAVASGRRCFSIHAQHCIGRVGWGWRGCWKLPQVEGGGLNECDCRCVLCDCVEICVHAAACRSVFDGCAGVWFWSLSEGVGHAGGCTQCCCCGCVLLPHATCCTAVQGVCLWGEADKTTLTGGQRPVQALCRALIAVWIFDKQLLLPCIEQCVLATDAALCAGVTQCYLCPRCIHIVMFWAQSLPSKHSDTACLWSEGMTVEGCNSRRLLRLSYENEMVPE
jgi:hypothetical protein